MKKFLLSLSLVAITPFYANDVNTSWTADKFDARHEELFGTAYCSGTPLSQVTECERKKEFLVKLLNAGVSIGQFFEKNKSDEEVASFFNSYREHSSSSFLQSIITNPELNKELREEAISLNTLVQKTNDALIDNALSLYRGKMSKEECDEINQKLYDTLQSLLDSFRDKANREVLSILIKHSDQE